MLSKLSVLNVAKKLWAPVRHFAGMSPLERFERLRQLCCTSTTEKRRQETVEKLRPRSNELEPCVKSCEECCGDNRLELMDIRCKTAMILGGASGIGFETANQFLKAGGLRVIVADIDGCAGVDSVKKLCATYGDEKAVYLMTDVVQKTSIEMAFRELYKRYCQIDVYVNSVGIYNETPQCWDKMIETNLIGCVRGTLLALKYMSRKVQDDYSQDSVIINVSSYGSIANIPSMPLFSAASNGIVGLTSSFGQDFHYSKSRVRCVTVCPSCTDSGLLKNMSRHHYDPQWVGFSTAAMKCCTMQSAKFVGQAIVNAAKFGPNGSVYVIKDGKSYRYLMPDYEKLMRQETILW